MRSLLARLARTLHRACSGRKQSLAAPPLVAVITGPQDIWVAAGALASDLRGRCGTTAVLVCAWVPDGFDGEISAPVGFPGARRLVARLASRGFDADACGTVCRVRLPHDPAAAAPAVVRAAVAAWVPTVVALGLDHPGFAAIVERADEVVLVPQSDASPATARTALAGPRHQARFPAGRAMAARARAPRAGRAGRPACHDGRPARSPGPSRRRLRPQRPGSARE